MENFNEWHNKYRNQHLRGSLALGLLFSTIIFFIINNFLNMAFITPFFIIGAIMLLGLVIAIFLFYYFGDFAKNCVAKFFCSDAATAQTLVVCILDADNISYRITDKEIALDNLQIRIWEESKSLGAVKGTVIAIGPSQDSNQSLIKRITQKIDEAFLPQGLNHL